MCNASGSSCWRALGSAQACCSVCILTSTQRARGACACKAVARCLLKQSACQRALGCAVHQTGRLQVWHTAKQCGCTLQQAPQADASEQCCRRRRCMPCLAQMQGWLCMRQNGMPVTCVRRVCIMSRSLPFARNSDPCCHQEHGRKGACMTHALNIAPSPASLIDSSPATRTWPHDAMPHAGGSPRTCSQLRQV